MAEFTRNLEWRQRGLDSASADTISVAADVTAIPVTHPYVVKTTGGDAEALTIVDGKPGQILMIQLAVDGGGDGTLTVGTNSTGTGWTTCLFADAGDTLILMYANDTVGWVVLSCWGLTQQPAIAIT